ncbi:MAG TPA: YccF domain-containing protein [Caulobacteraceae bacterium]|nr:YccF domain-containing protein [Caulobacteraceae bacterium]
MTLLLNILWFIFGGFFAGLAWLFAGLLLAITIVGLPWAQAAFRIGLFTFMPFGRQVVSRRAMTGREDLGTGPLGLLLNVVWFLLGGWYIALAHLVLGVVQLVLIITIPFGVQHLKLAAIALAPIGKDVIET